MNQRLILLTSPWTWLAATYIAIAIAAQFFPLTADLHYEFSAVLALWASLGTGLTVVWKAGRHSTDRSIRQRPDGSTFRQSGARAVLLSLLPLALPLLLAPFRQTCGMLEGIAWYLLLVPASAWISGVLALLATALIRRRWLRMLGFLLLWSLPLLRGAYEAYFGPHIFMYSWQVGFFPGGSWDAELPITGTLIIYRLAHLLVACALALVVLEYGRTHGERASASRREVPVVAGLIALLAVALIPLRSDLGLTRTHAWIQQELGDSLTTNFTTIYYDRAHSDSLDIWRAANYADFYVEEHARLLKLDNETQKQLHFTLYLYPSPQEEKRMVGTSSAAFTKPWLAMLNMPITRAEGTLRHELAHLMLARFGGLLGVSISQGLLEGAAMAMENNYGWRTLHEYARGMYAFNMAPPVEQVMSFGGFSSRRSSLSYVLAGSFSQWLIERYGIERYLHVYPWGNFDKAYGRSLHELSDEYQAFIDSIPPPPASSLPTFRYLFGGGSFFFQKCLRRIGTLNSDGYEALSLERYDRALGLFRESLEEGINYSARAGVLRAFAGLGDYRQLLDSAAEYARDTASYPLLPMLIEQGDANWALGDTALARRLYDSVVALDISQALSMRAALRLLFLSTSDSIREPMRQYFTLPMRLPQRLLMLRNLRLPDSAHALHILIPTMEAVLIADQLPMTAVDTGIMPLLFSPSKNFGIISSMSPEELKLLKASAALLTDALLYSTYLTNRIVTPHLSTPPSPPIPPFLYDYTPTAYLYHRKEEQMRFARYLSTGGITLP